MSERRPTGAVSGGAASAGIRKVQRQGAATSKPMLPQLTARLPARFQSSTFPAIVAGTVAEAAVLWWVRASFPPRFQGVLLVGLVSGVVAGLLTHEYGSALKNGLFAGLFGVALYAAAYFTYGVWVSVSRGFGVDSVVTLNYGVTATATSIVLAPVFTAEGAVAAVAVHALLLRRR